MKLARVFCAAGLIVASLGVSATADAQRYDRHDHGWNRHHQGWHDRGRHNGWNNHHRRCHSEWHHHHRVTRCY